MRPVFERKQQGLRMTLPEAPVWVAGDATRLEQVFTNLLSNANKYTQEQGDIQIHLREGPVDQGDPLRDRPGDRQRRGN